MQMTEHLFSNLTFSEETFLLIEQPLKELGTEISTNQN